MEGGTASEPEATSVEPRDWMPWLLGVGGFIAVLVAALAFALAGFRIGQSVIRAAPWVTLVLVLITLKITVPNSRLAPDRRRRRERRTDGALIGILAGLAVVFCTAAAFYLTSLAEWLVLGVFFLGAFGVGLMLRARFTIGPG